MFAYTRTSSPFLANESAPWLEPRLAHYGLDLVDMAAAAAAADAAQQPLLSNESAPWLEPRLANYGVDMPTAVAAAAADAALEPLLANKTAPWDTSGKEDLSLVRLMAGRQKACGEMATPTTLLTSMALRYMDYDNVLDIIPQLILDYNSEH
ncbi:hypothetical protein GGI13_003528 [Coemansia sp. RSA 455]|nr:hypothetical protein GGI13_003528 [Coemansia sp. RSA 455]